MLCIGPQPSQVFQGHYPARESRKEERQCLCQTKFIISFNITLIDKIRTLWKIDCEYQFQAPLSHHHSELVHRDHGPGLADL